MKKGNLTAILLTGAALVGVAGYAAAERGERHMRGFHHGMMKGDMMDKLDTDGDGAISKAEIEAAQAERFAAADANGDGGLTLEEIETYREARRAERMQARKQRMFDERDTDGDGVLSMDEFTPEDMPMFDRVDADANGVISPDEIEAMKEHRGWRHGRRGQKSDDADSGSDQ